MASPPSFAPFGGDRGTISVAVRDATTVRAYLNLTPRQGRERLHGFAQFRTHLVGEDDGRDVHVEAAAERLPFGGGTGSCVQEQCTTRVARHRYREIACLVAGRTTSVVVVAAARTSVWRVFERELRRSVASLTVS